MQNNQNRGLAHNASKNDLSDNNYEYDNQTNLQDSPPYNNGPSKEYGIPRRKPPIHKNNRNVNPKNMDLYNPSGLNDLGQSMLPTIGSASELSNPLGGSSQQRAQYNIPPQPRGMANQNMAYVNISSEGAKPVGPIGLKRAEKELIMRRYKHAYHQNDNINRVAWIYGQQPAYNS